MTVLDDCKDNSYSCTVREHTENKLSIGTGLNISTATITASLLTLSLTTVFVAQASPYDHGKITAEDLATDKVYSPYVG